MASGGATTVVHAQVISTILVAHTATYSQTTKMEHNMEKPLLAMVALGHLSEKQFDELLDQLTHVQIYIIAALYGESRYSASNIKEIAALWHCAEEPVIEAHNRAILKIQAYVGSI